ncbi:MAG: Nodulation protein NoeA-related protein [Candidatus Nomurabacteria bacterium GW2011_GWB1_40_7]|uniref:Nodulation protein NoeA-related protein n=1 Tax=Candidatus Nomurabacteria bacterium GW2011_GWB1_40_7 TaxID=1618744 RepID=A0A0G0VC82_9BACT|nr:MAG: Nodulation protein NoeA-related protein [Candidatus Nomurabacteria bacterium GW2011_GWB1_40_7]
MKIPRKKMIEEIPGSFRDPSGFVYKKNNILYRQINYFYQDNYDQFINSGLYSELTSSGLLIKHEEIENQSDGAYKTLRPDVLPFISYPYEWGFSQLKDTALLTLRIQKIALKFGMSLKDASAYNIQFIGANPIFIDTLSFEKYKDGDPWVAYRQFCQHFLNPLLLMKYADTRLNKCSGIFIDGIPLDLTSAILPARTYFTPSILFHVHLHAKSQKHFSDKKAKKYPRKISKQTLLGLIDGLERFVKGLRWNTAKTEWGEYYSFTNYSPRAFEHKKEIIGQFIDKKNPGIVWDFGANDGSFSRMAGNRQIKTVSFDADYAAIEKNYLKCKREGDANILPLVLDLTNPSPAIGWSHHERMSLIERGPADMALALALLHHLAIANNLPFAKIAEFFSKICKYLVIEFVPKDDSNARRLLANREDIFSDYTQESFEYQFKKYFSMESAVPVEESDRILYLMKNSALK